MKTLAKILMSVSLLAPMTLMPTVVSAQEAADEVNLDEVERAAYNLAYRARLAKDFVESELSGSRGKYYQSKAIRLTRELNALAVYTAEDAAAGAPQEELLADQQEIETLFFQIDSTKRQLARTFRDQKRDIEDVFNDIRTAYYAYKLALTGSL
ncbi:hypothetical protein [Pseudobacteriovorax antillogorgiicola]|uniref:Uncharacterized protein n=1 Tax=Pseudobacteriovorax antillogorgiicola TaxID=1513793 RepID=A0A1Y6CG90_9BACT|nr:hypothetical protein [Pseudobacteriovorax antillogorgiicola]TCS47294.1 hypothetical protein EDD56_12169 [Pseudobacteriovorax antillogorgiicola]SMF62419.1 hypothetical protein SAMN06296036_12169 [Pseudobacteriovorax antillogorgiicola]